MAKAMNPQDRVLFIAKRGYGLTSSRSMLIQRFLDAGWNVGAVCSSDTESHRLQEMGASLERVEFGGSGMRVIMDVVAFFRLVLIYRRWNPGLTHQFHAKPLILGTVAARLACGGKPVVVNTITGLGRAFERGGWAGAVGALGYRVAMGLSDAAIFQNPDDRALFVERGWVDPAKGWLVRGAGVDVQRYSVERGGDQRSGRPTVVVMLGRLLRQKGIPEFLSVAERIRGGGSNARFVLAGETERDQSDAVSPACVRADDNVEYLGYVRDVPGLLAAADLLLFPSYYREGLPRVVLEASAAGIPTVAFDLPGIREAVRHGETGYLVEYPDIDALTDRVRALIEDEGTRVAMGDAACRMAVDEFSSEAVERAYFAIYRACGVPV